MPHVEHVHDLILDREENSELPVEQLTDLTTEVVVLRSKRAPSRKGAERLEGRLSTTQP